MPTDPKTVNKWASRIVPTFLAAAVVYATYVFVGELCVKYLLKEPRISNGIPIALLTIYFILLICMLATYGRLAYIIIFDPGYLPLGPNAEKSKKSSSHRRVDRHSEEYGRDYDSSEEVTGGADANPDSPGLERFYSKRVFVCNPDGRPKWCNVCMNWKPDRTHHCSDVGRCVYKMDHYCPWVGGVVGENSFKFFIQFVFYAALFCIFNVIVMAIYLARKLDNNIDFNAHFIVLLVLSGFFGLFTMGMFGSSMQFALYNLTTIENLSNKRRPWTLAVLIPPSYQVPKEGHYPHITYPLPLPASTSAQTDGSTDTQPPAPPNGLVSNSPSHLRLVRDQQATRTFAITTLGIGRNPWDLGYSANFRSIMGDSVIDWFLPIKRSPNTRHESEESHFEYGRWVERLMVDLGFMGREEMSKPRPVSKPVEERRDHLKALFGGGEKKERREGVEMKEQNGNGMATSGVMAEQSGAPSVAITAEGIPRRAH